MPDMTPEQRAALIRLLCAATGQAADEEEAGELVDRFVEFGKAMDK